MTRRTALLRLLSSATALALVMGGCNQILGNRAGDTAIEAPDSAAPVDAAEPESCAVSRGNKDCFGLCVAIDQPSTGCGGEACTGCDPKNVVSASCRGGGSTFECAYDACTPGFANCNGNTADGCETSIGRKESCGGCDASCDASAPLCALDGRGTYGCVAACPPSTEDCGGECVDTTSSVEHCGRCGRSCTRAGATASCAAGACTYQCVNGTHACGELCVSDLDPAACGDGCVVCPEPPNSRRACVLGVCRAPCRAGYLDCDGDPANGCERQGAVCPTKPACATSSDCPYNSTDRYCCDGICQPSCAS